MQHRRTRYHWTPLVGLLFVTITPACLEADEDDSEFVDEEEDVIFRPRNPACPACYLKPTGAIAVVAALDDGWQSLTDTNVLVTLTLTNATVVSYNLGNVDLTATAKTLPLVPSPTSPVASGQITITFAGSPPIVTTGDLLGP